MKNISKIALIFMLLLPIVAQAGALEARTILEPITENNEIIDLSFKKIDFKTKENNQSY